jgi:hypothetical protein
VVLVVAAVDVGLAIMIDDGGDDDAVQRSCDAAAWRT